MHLSTKVNLEKFIGITTTLFVIVVVLDPADVIFRLKMPLFAFLIGLCIITYRNVLKDSVAGLITIYGICLITSAMGSFREVNINWEFAISIYKGFTMAFLLLWAHKLRILEKLYLPLVIIFFLVITTYIAMNMNPDIETLIHGLTLENSLGIPLGMSRRTFIGIPIISVFYKTSPLGLFVAGVFLYKLFNNVGSRKSNLFMVFSSVSILILGGTRMNILSAIVIVSFAIIQRFYKTRHGKEVATILFLIGIGIIVVITTTLLNDKGEDSLEVKTVLSKAFYRQVDKNPSLLFFGEGAGATFNSLGIRGKEAVQSELTYQDMIRWFGIPMTVLIMFIYLYPLLTIFKKRKKLNYGAILSVAYLLYLAIAGTNPLLITSTGMLALLTIYSYAYNPNYETPPSLLKSVVQKPPNN